MRTICIFLIAICWLPISLLGQEKEKQPENARQLLEILKDTEGCYSWPTFRQELNWVKDADIPFLMRLLDSKKECAHVVLPASSHIPMEKSTVGHQAAYMIEGYWKRFYPSKLSSDRFKPDYQEIKSWHWNWARLRKVEQSTAADAAGGAAE